MGDNVYLQIDKVKGNYRTYNQLLYTHGLNIQMVGCFTHGLNIQMVY